jgi:tetratricopeptide (TPR) repeat protein
MRFLFIAAVLLAIFGCSQIARAQVRAPGQLPSIEQLIDGGRLSEAREQLRKLAAAEGESARTLFLEAVMLNREKRFQESNGFVEKALRLEPTSAVAWKLAGLNLVGLGHEAKAEDYFARAVELDPKDAMARYYLGMSLLSQHFAERAERVFREALLLNPAYPDTWCVLGLALETQGKELEAVKAYQENIEVAEKLGSTSGKPYLCWARYLTAQQRYADALPAIERALAANSEDPEALRLMGKSLAGLGREKAALDYLERAVSIDPKDRAAQYQLVLLYRKLGRAEDAKRARRAFDALPK